MRTIISIFACIMWLASFASDNPERPNLPEIIKTIERSERFKSVYNERAFYEVAFDRCISEITDDKYVNESLRRIRILFKEDSIDKNELKDILKISKDYPSIALLSGIISDYYRNKDFPLILDCLKILVERIKPCPVNERWNILYSIDQLIGFPKKSQLNEISHVMEDIIFIEGYDDKANFQMKQILFNYIYSFTLPEDTPQPTISEFNSEKEQPGENSQIQPPSVPASDTEENLPEK